MRILFCSRRKLWQLGAVFLLVCVVVAGAILAERKVLATAGKIESKPVYEVATESNMVAISFDASWGADYTLQLLDTLDAYNAGATFFLVTLWIEEYPEMVAEIASRGHEIGLHSTTHPHFTQLTDAEIVKELEENYQAVVSATAAFPTLFRPPFGDYNSHVVELVRSQGYEVIQWSIDSLDWKDLSADEIFDRVTKDIHAGDIVLFHNNGLHTAEALPRILEYLQQQDLQVVNISQLLLPGESYVDANGVQRQLNSAVSP